MFQKASTKKILFLDPANFVGGAELFLLNFMKFILEENLSLSLFTTGLKTYVDQVPAGVKVSKVDMPRLRRNWKVIFELIRSVKVLRTRINKDKPDLVVSNTIRSHVLSGFALKRENIPLIWILHDYTFPKIFLRLLIRVPYRIICVSHGVRRSVLRTVGNKYQYKIVVITNAVDLLEISRLKEAPLSLAQEKADSEFWIGNIGRIEPWKGQLFFLLAAEKVIQALP